MEEEEEYELAQQRTEYRSKLSHKIRTGPIGTQRRGETNGSSSQGPLKNVLLSKATSFRSRQLLIRWGVSPWVLLVKERR
jgi:hypothetical protein